MICLGGYSILLLLPNRVGDENAQKVVIDEVESVEWLDTDAENGLFMHQGTGDPMYLHVVASLTAEVL